MTPKLIGPWLKHGSPILAGPWRSELGFEVLYWIPYLKWVEHRVGRPVIPITRGGMAALYGVPKGLELLAMRKPEELRHEQVRAGLTWRSIKQWRPTPWEVDVMRDAEETLGESCHWLFPSVMYRHLSPFWDLKKGLQFLLPYQRIHLPLPCEKASLGRPYVACHFYLRPTFQLDEGEFYNLLRALQRLRKQMPVVNVGPLGVPGIDDHVDFPLPPLDEPTEHPQPTEHLLRRAQWLAGASLFIGTYGGTAQLAVKLGVPTIAAYTHWGGTSDAHYAYLQFQALRAGVAFSLLPWPTFLQMLAMR